MVVPDAESALNKSFKLLPLNETRYLKHYLSALGLNPLKSRFYKENEFENVSITHLLIFLPFCL